MTSKTTTYTWRNIDWREVDRIEGAPGTNVTVHLKGGGTIILGHHPGEGTYQRARAYLKAARNAARILNRQDTPRYTLRQVEDMAKDVGLHVAYDPNLRDTRGGPFTISRCDTWEAIASGHTLDEVAGCVQGIAWALSEYIGVGILLARPRQ